MRILVTNDDGIHAPGLQILENIARTFSDDVWICAPEKDQSGVGRSITMNEPLRLREVSKQKYALTGTPTDCVIMGVRKLLPAKPDLVLSGVNSGENICDYVTYSGTVAGAMEGSLLGIKSIAFSQSYVFDHGVKTIPWQTAQDHAPAIIKKLIDLKTPKRTFFNVNFPNCNTDKVAGVEITSQGINEHVLGMEERNDGRGLPYYWLSFSKSDELKIPGSDLEALRQNKISVTPLKVDKTDQAFHKSLNQVF